MEILSFRKGGLRTKMLIGACLIAIIPVAVLGTIAVFNAKSTVEKETEEQIQMISKGMADMVDGIMISEANSLGMLAQRDSVVQAVKDVNAGGAPKGDFSRELGKLQAVVQDRYNYLVVAGKDGIAFADTVNGKTKGTNVTDRDYYKKAMQGKISLDNAAFSKSTGEPQCGLAYPIKDESGQVIGAMLGMLKVTFLAAKINDIKLGQTGYAYMINKEGTVIAYPDKKQVLQLNILKEPGMEELAKKATSGLGGVEKYSYKGVEKYAGFSPVKANGWSVVTAVPSSEMLQSVYTTRNIIFFGVIIFMAIAAVVAFVAARAIAVPIQGAVEKLNAGSDQIASASGQVSKASQSLAEGSSEQASAIEEISSSMEEMSSMTRQNADNSTMAKNLMAEARVIVGRVNQQIENMSSAIGEISKTSEETGKIIRTIDEIAFQTNLLALNAAVEAARAGEAGAGFAVVADEVRNLAMRAAEAAKNTSSLIENTIKVVKEGNELTEATRDGFKENVEIAMKIGNLIDEIAAASSEQAQGIEQINKAIHEMDKVVQQNAANAEESASASEELNSQAVAMEDIVGELVKVVGGNGRILSESIIEHKVDRRLKSLKKRLQLPGTKKIGAGEVRPDQVIPMDESEFREF